MYIYTYICIDTYLYTDLEVRGWDEQHEGHDQEHQTHTEHCEYHHHTYFIDLINRRGVLEGVIEAVLGDLGVDIRGVLGEMG